MFMIKGTNVASLLFFVLRQNNGKWVSLPILHPYPSSSTPPFSAPAEQRQLLFVSYMLCWRLWSQNMSFDWRWWQRYCCVWEQRWGEEIILKIMLGLVPVRFLFGASATFSDIFNRDRACMCGAEAAVGMRVPYPAPFSCSKHSSFLYGSSGCFHLKKTSLKRSIALFLSGGWEVVRESVSTDSTFSSLATPKHLILTASPSAFLNTNQMPRVCMRPWAKWQVRLLLK